MALLAKGVCNQCLFKVCDYCSRCCRLMRNSLLTVLQSAWKIKGIFYIYMLEFVLFWWGNTRLKTYIICNQCLKGTGPLVTTKVKRLLLDSLEGVGCLPLWCLWELRWAYRGNRAAVLGKKPRTSGVCLGFLVRQRWQDDCGKLELQRTGRADV